MIGCSANGPPFRKDPAAPAAPFAGRFAFDVPVSLYHTMQLGEVILEPASRDPNYTGFRLRMAGRDRKLALRMRSYEGRAVMRDGRLELRAQRCYEFGKRAWEGRLVPQERWDCDHLVFSFESSDEFRTRKVLLGVKTDRSRFSDWMGRFDLTPLPLPDGRPLLRDLRPDSDAYFAGRVMGVLENGKVVVWGYRAGYLIKRGQELELIDTRQRPLGKLRVVSHPGSYLITETVGALKPANVKHGMISFTRQWPKSPGLFGLADEQKSSTQR